MEALEASCLAGGDEEADWAWVPVLEELEAEATSGADLNALSGTSRARASGDDVAVAWREGGDGTDLSTGASVVVSSGLRSNVVEVGEGQTARAGHGEGRGLEVALLREEEDDSAGLAGVVLRDIEVEDGGLGA